MRLGRRKHVARPRRRIRKRRLLALLAVLWLLSGVAFTFGLVRAVASEIPQLDPAKWQPERNGYIYALNDDGSRRVLAVLRGEEARTLVELDEISPWMRHAIVAIEDKRFWEHRGVDVRGIARALWSDIREGQVVEGGSTIVQQFVKNAYVRNRRTIARKVREAALAWQLHQRWSKERILTAYLNTVYFGNGAYGVQQASLAYFGKGAKRLELHEAALLAGIPQDPSLYDPVTNPRAARERRAIVLRAMLDQRDITQAEYERAVTRPLPDPRGVRLPGTQGPAPYFVNYVKEQLVATLGADAVFGGGLEVTTTIDLELQDLAHKAIAKVIGNGDEEGPSAALVALDPRDGSVKAMVGGRNFRESQFNLAVQGERQPGSAFKPFVLAAALEQGISPATRFDSEPQNIPLGDRTWTVANYENAYYGNVDLATATVESDNSVYAQLTLLVGPGNVAKTARALGVRSDLDPYYAIGLGVEAVNPLEMARAYASFANGGKRVDGSLLGNRPRVITQIEDPGGTTRVNRPVGQPVLTETQASIVTSILQRVIDDGTGARARLRNRPAAGKTGTTENYGDAWFVGYTPQLVVAVWVGYAETLRPMLTEYHGRAVSGGTFPAEIWKEFMTVALDHEREEPQYFPAPPYVATEARLVTRRGGRVQLDNGLCRARREVVYFAGMAPRSTAACKPNEVEVPLVVGKDVREAQKRLAGQPLAAELVYAPAQPRTRPWRVVKQYPSGGYLSSYSKVKLVVTKPIHGVVPDLVGKTLAAAELRLKKRRLKSAVTFGAGEPGTILRQTPAAGVAAAPGLEVRLVVARD